MKKKLISILIPFYNEKESLRDIVSEIKKIEKKIYKNYLFEIILLDNHSNDSSNEIGLSISSKDPSIKYFRLSRNFGYQANILSGYNICKGDAAIQIDADGQDDPSLIIKFISKWEEGYKVVYGIRKNRRENIFIKFIRKIFYRMLYYISEINIPIDAGDFRLIDRKVINHLKKFKERNLYLRGIFSYIGFEQIGIEYDRKSRKKGKSKFNLYSYFGLAFIAIISFSKKPLLFIFFSGFLLFSISLTLLIYYFLNYLSGNITEPGFPTIVLILLTFFGLTFLYLGIMSLYIAQIHDEVKKRPLYIPENNEKED